jgi:acetyl esterase
VGWPGDPGIHLEFIHLWFIENLFLYGCVYALYRALVGGRDTDPAIRPSEPIAPATALRARDEGLELVLQLLVTPGIGDRSDSGSRRLFANGFLIDAATVQWFFDHAVPREHRRDPRFAPIEAAEHEGLCPALLLLAECDPVVDDGIGYADRLRLAGVPVDLEIYRGVTHDFMKMGRVLPEALLALDRAAAALRTAWNLNGDLG